MAAELMNVEESKYRVFLKEYKKGDQLWENKPHLTYGIYMIVTSILFFGGIFGLIFANCSGFLLTIYLIGIWVICIVLAIYRNEMCNMSKSTAFIERNGVLYSVKIGYLNEIDYKDVDVVDAAFLGVTTAHNLAVAEQVQREEKIVRMLRKQEKPFIDALEYYLEYNEKPQNVLEIIHLKNPKIEKKNNWSITISYDYKGKRKIKKYRNAYPLDFEV